MRIFACVLKSGGDYTPKHVHILRSMVRKHIPTVEYFVCFTDMDIPDMDTLPLVLGLPGKYSMMEVFALSGSVMVMGLDSIIVENLDHVFDAVENGDPNDFWMINSFNPKRKFANGIMVWNGDWSRLITAYPVEVATHYDLEQRYTIKKLEAEKANIRRLNDLIKIASYKKHCQKGMPEGTDVVLFHGFPRPHQVRDLWVKELYG